DLVIPGGRDHDLAPLKRGVVEGADLARVGEQPLRPRHAVDLDGLGVLVDQEHFVPVLEQFLRDRPADRARTSDSDSHQWLPFPGAAGLANTAATSLRSASLVSTCRTSPCCSTVLGPG